MSVRDSGSPRAPGAEEGGRQAPAGAAMGQRSACLTPDRLGNCTSDLTRRERQCQEGRDRTGQDRVQAAPRGWRRAKDNRRGLRGEVRAAGTSHTPPFPHACSAPHAGSLTLAMRERCPEIAKCPACKPGLFIPSREHQHMRAQETGVQYIKNRGQEFKQREQHLQKP